MAGNLNDAMAEAVDDAAIVIVCMSQYYKDSANCKKGWSSFNVRFICLRQLLYSS